MSTPDVIVQPDTLTSEEQKLLTALAPKAQIVRSTLVNYAVEQKGKVQPNFVVSKAWRDEFYNRLVAQGVKVDKAQFEAGGSEIDRLLGSSIARIAFGDSITVGPEPNRVALDVYDRAFEKMRAAITR